MPVHELKPGEIINTTGLVLLDFKATWCGPCKALAPFLEKESAKHTNCRFYSVDVDQHSALASQYNISCMPTVVILVNGKVNARIEGVDTGAIMQALDALDARPKPK